VSQDGFYGSELNILIGGEVPWYIRPRHIFLHDVQMFNISSTMVRNMCKRGNNEFLIVEEFDGVVSEWVTLDIVQNHLYKGGE
jgi:hypothetical protein